MNHDASHFNAPELSGTAGYFVDIFLALELDDSRWDALEELRCAELED
jgi:hypothetical protein